MKHLRLPRLLLVLVALVLVAAACGGSSADDNTVVASINGRELTRSQLDQLLPDGDNTVDTRIASTVGTWMLAQALEAELDDRGYGISQDDYDFGLELIEAQEIARNDLEAELAATAYALSAAAGRWTDDEAANLDDPEIPGYLCSNHLLVETEEEAQAALDRYDAGEAFADLAIELSTGPSGPSGGDLGCAAQGQYVAEFEDAAYAGESGDVVGPVETQFGWHLIEIESVGPATVENHPEADEAQLSALADAARELQVSGLVTELEAAAAGTYGADAFVDASIGTLDPTTLLISAG